jgi:hypothetical protein
VIDIVDTRAREEELKGTATNVLAFDAWTIPHAALGYLAASSGVPLAAAIWGALAIEAVEIGMSRAVPDLARESRANQLGDLAAFLAAYGLGAR